MSTAKRPMIFDTPPFLAKSLPKKLQFARFWKILGSDWKVIGRFDFCKYLISLPLEDWKIWKVKKDL